MQRTSTRQFPQKLAWHLLREFALPLVGSIAAFVVICLLLAVFDDLPDFNGVDIPASMTLKYFLARVPENLLMAFPISAMLAVSFMNMVLGKNNELTAIRSAGLSLMHTATYVWLVALLLCCSIFALSEFIQPACIRYVGMVKTDYLDNPARQKSSKTNAHRKSTKPTLNQLAYYTPKMKQEWFFADFKADAPCNGISVCTQDDRGRPLKILSAAEGEYSKDAGQWFFKKVSITEYDYKDNLPSTKPALFLDEFPNAENLANRIYRENPRDIAIQSRPLEELPLKDLLRMRRKKIFTDSRNANLVGTLAAYRLASPLATLIATLLGFALTLTKGRTTPVKGFVTAVGLFVAYYLVAQIFLVLGKNNHLWWLLAGTLPTLAMLAFAVHLNLKRQ
ncbi:MAG: LptF/LptG family permease [Lentisphaeria bacterium]|nr:LptF/LptG family permease [Lentisphaeria bacterium]